MRGAGLLHQPALHFFAIGGLLFAADSVLSQQPEAPAPAVGESVSERTRALREAWTARTGAPPDPDVLASLVRAELDDELWIAEARRRGLHRSDAVVRRRLVRNMRFVRENDPRDDGALFAEALELGMDRTDPVVRRRLVQLMKLGVKAAARAQEPTEAELRAHFERDRARHRQPPRVRLAHVYLSRDRRGARARFDAGALRDELARQGLGPEAAGRHGDPFLIPGQLPPRSEEELARDFGPDFARAVAEIEPGAWSRPVPSAYGFHLVWILERTEARDPSLDEVRTAVRESLLAERADRAVARAQDELRTRPR